MPRKNIEIRKCKWCDKPAKKYYQGTRFKGYCSTCGSEECLKKARHDKNVRQSKRYERIKICEICGNEYITHCHSSKWCKNCIPNKHARTIYERYKLLPVEEKRLKEKNYGICPICNERKACAIDHDHETGKVRGYICSKCNLGLHFMENKELRKRLDKYLKGEM